jgi:hypothetical protein
MANVTLESVVKSLINEIDGSVHHYGRLYRLGIDVLRDFNMNVNGIIKTVVKTLSSIKTVGYPIDMINYYRVGVINSSGEIATVTKNINLSNSFNDIATRLSHISSTAYVGAYKNLDGRGDAILASSSMPEVIGQMKTDDVKRLFVFDANFSYSEIVVEYLSNGFDLESEYMVDERVAKAVQADIYLRSIEKLKNISLNEKRLARRNLSVEKTNARLQLKPLRISEINDSLRKGTKYSLKG